MKLLQRQSLPTDLLDGFTLKILALIFMVVDHIGEFIPGMPIWLRYIGRLSAPIFFFLMVEAFFHSHNLKKYFVRLLACGIGMQVVNWILAALLHDPVGIPNNIFLGLAGCFLMIYFIDQFMKGKDKIVSLIGVILSMIFTLFTEAGLIGIAMTLAFYFFHERPLALSVAYIIVSLYVSGIFYFYSWQVYILQNPQWMMLFALVPILLYNGKRGKGGFAAKYVFYAFYPLHIWTLYLIGYWIG